MPQPGLNQSADETNPIDSINGNELAPTAASNRVHESTGSQANRPRSSGHPPSTPQGPIWSSQTLPPSYDEEGHLSDSSVQDTGGELRGINEHTNGVEFHGS